MTNDFFANEYFAPQFWPEGYFGPQQNAADGSMAASLSGAATVSADINATADASAGISGASTVSAAINSGEQESTGGQSPWRRGRGAAMPTSRRGRVVIIAKMSASLSGAAKLEASGDLQAAMAAGLSGKCRVSARCVGVKNYAASDNEFWLLAA